MLSGPSAPSMKPASPTPLTTVLTHDPASPVSIPLPTASMTLAPMTPPTTSRSFDIEALATPVADTGHTAAQDAQEPLTELQEPTNGAADQDAVLAAPLKKTARPVPKNVAVPDTPKSPRKPRQAARDSMKALTTLVIGKRRRADE